MVQRFSDNFSKNEKSGMRLKVFLFLMFLYLCINHENRAQKNQRSWMFLLNDATCMRRTPSKVNTKL